MARSSGKYGVALMVLSLSGAALAQTGGGSSGASGGSGGTGGAASGTGAGVGAPTTPGGLSNQQQSNQNQQTGAGARNAGPPMQSTTQPTGNPAISGSGRDAAARTRSAAQCEQVLARRADHSGEEIAACERVNDDPAAALDRRLQRQNSRAVNSICRGC